MAYIGKSPTGTGVRSRYYYTATGGETSLSGADDNSNTLVFSDGNYVDVSLNGIALVAGTDYNTSTANTIAGLSALSASDIVEIVVYDIFTVADTVSAKDGGTFSGNVTMGGTLSVTGASTATGGLNVGTIKEATGTTTAMTVDSTGRILTPARPAFLVHRNNVAITLTEGNEHQILPFNTVAFDIGNNYSTTNFNYVCPVAGVYFFALNARFDNLASGGFVRGLIYKGNDASTLTTPYSDVGDVLAVIKGNHATNYETVTVSGVLQCSAGDIVTPMGGHLTDASITLQAESQFSGFLVG